MNLFAIYFKGTLKNYKKENEFSIYGLNIFDIIINDKKSKIIEVTNKYKNTVNRKLKINKMLRGILGMGCKYFSYPSTFIFYESLDTWVNIILKNNIIPKKVDSKELKIFLEYARKKYENKRSN